MTIFGRPGFCRILDQPVDSLLFIQYRYDG